MKLLLNAVSILLPSLIFANISVVVSVPPVASLIKSIGGGYVDVVTMVPPGASPHTYEPRPSQMQALADADLYAVVGTEFDKVWLPRFRDVNPSLRVVRLDTNITKLPMEEAQEHHDAREEHRHDGFDPHIWTSPANMLVMGRTLMQALGNVDPAHAAEYRANFAAFKADTTRLDDTLRRLLSPLPPRSAFLTFHPSWGYFAHAYGLRQLSVETEGKSPSPKRLAQVIELARRARVRAVIAQPEFSDKAAKLIARQLGIGVVKLSPLDPDWQETLRRLAQTVAKGGK